MESLQQPTVVENNTNVPVQVSEDIKDETTTLELNQPPPPPPPPRQPKNWPQTVRFLIDYTIDPTLNLTHLPAITPFQIEKHNLQLMNPKPYAAPHAHIQQITDPKHPAYGQFGLFASRDIGYNTHVVDYIGQVISADSEKIKTSDYVLDFGGGGEGYVVVMKDSEEEGAAGDDGGHGREEVRLACDSEEMGNEGRMVNDFRGVPYVPEYSERKTFNSKKKVSSNPEYAMYANKSKANVEFRSYVNKAEGGCGEMRMGLFVSSFEGIKQGKELLISYGKGYWASRGLDLGNMYNELKKI
ncbi:hypothetical protein BDR26DRAFT_861748 [Obelidium mucronatum]|nr:hypothetical protein BDR26DRAFT_861748 [Obelidium mucronatum]